MFAIFQHYAWKYQYLYLLLFLISGNNGEFLLTVTNKYNNTGFYGYDGWRFYPTKVQPVDPIFKNAETLSYYIDKEHPTFLVYNKNTSLVNVSDNIYRIDFMKTFPKYELFEKTVQAVQELNRTVYQELVPQVKEFNITFQETKDDIVFSDKDNNISGMPSPYSISF